MAHIHGGGFRNGSGAGDYSLLSRTGNVVVVSLNYRLNIFGFAAHHAFGPNSGDYGLQDQQAVIARVRTERVVGSESEDVQPIVQADDNDIARPAEQRIVTRAGAIAESASVNVGHYSLTIRSRRRPDVEVEAILVAAGGLQALAGVSSGLQHAAPGGRRLGRRPAEIPDGRRGVGNPLPRIDSADENAADGPVVRLHGRAWVARPIEVDDGTVTRIDRINLHIRIDIEALDDRFCKSRLTGGRQTYRQKDVRSEHPRFGTGHRKEQGPLRS